MRRKGSEDEKVDSVYKHSFQSLPTNRIAKWMKERGLRKGLWLIL
jgi:hypothetical protein